MIHLKIIFVSVSESSLITEADDFSLIKLKSLSTVKNRQLILTAIKGENMKNLTSSIPICIVLILFGCQLISAQDTLPQKMPRVLNNRSSPFAPPEKSDRSFSTDKGPKLDTGCIYRSSGPIIFNIEIKRFLGDLNGDGTLQNVQELIANGLISKEVELIMPAFDVDSGANQQGVQPELDRISVNGFEVGFLRGQNNQWVNNSFKIPIEKIKFADKGTNGNEPTGGINEIRIDIDTANSSEAWCTSIDWGTVTFRAMSPVILIHGNGSNGGFFERRHLTTLFDDKGVVYDKSIELNPNTLPNGLKDTKSIATNGNRLNQLIPGIVKQFGAQNVHLIAHSKGGLDTREYLAKHQRTHDEDFKILSLTTLGTPHNGSVLADISIARRNALAQVGVLADDIDLENFPAFTLKVLETVDKNGIDRGREDLTTDFVALFNQNNLGLLDSNITFSAVGGDADRDSSQSINNANEIIELVEESPELQGESEFKRILAVNAGYQNLRLNQTVTTTLEERCTIGLFCKNVLIIRPVANPKPLGNDTLVTEPSASGQGTFGRLTTNSQTFTGTNGRNHSSIANEGVAQTIFPWLLEADRMKGGLK